MTWFIQPYLGLTYTLRSFMIVIVAGLGNLPGVILAGTGLALSRKPRASSSAATTRRHSSSCC